MHYSPQVPEDEATPQAVPPPELIVYANRIMVTRSLRSLTNRLLIAALLFIPIAYALHAFIQSDLSNNPVASFSLTLFVIAYVLLLGKLTLNRWIIARALLANDEPVLRITSEGIVARGSLSLSTIFLAWSEIEAVDVYTLLYKYLCVRPRNMATFMQRLPLLERLLTLSDAFYGMPPLSVSLFYLDRPVEEILQQLYHMYAKELSYYHVQIRS